MKLQTELYKTSLEILPTEGQYIIGQEQDDQMVVYQAFKPATANFAVEHQFFGGDTYSYNRMSWIKPNFLWMMYRCGWCSKEGQERVLAIWIDKADFGEILSQAVFSTFKSQYYKSEEEWKEE